MCLVSKKKEPEIAEEDILCYKLLQCKGKEFVTPFRKTVIEKEIIQGEKLLVAEGDDRVSGCEPTVLLSEGFIHTYSEKSEAKRDKMIVFSGDPGFRLFECIIPKGTLYYKGTYLDFASKSIKIIKEIES